MSEGHVHASSSSRRNSNMELPLAVASAKFPGFRFSPTDEELISYYLKKKIEGSHSCVEIISEVEIWKHEPWDLPDMAVIRSENEWFFFSPRGRKYPNGSQSKRATASGYWKATGKEREVKCGSNVIGTKRTLVFHIGRAPRGRRTQWIMHEYCMNEKSHFQDSMVVCRLRKNNDFHLNETPTNEGNNSNVNNDNDNDNNTMGLSGVDHSGSSGGGNVGDNSCPKEYKSGFNSCSHSVELTESESDSDDKPINEISGIQHSGLHIEDFCDEEEWFADIMKDEIVKLDGECSVLVPSHLDEVMPQAAATSISKSDEKADTQQPCEGDTNNNTLTDQMFPLQGTASRRLKLRKGAAVMGISDSYRGSLCLISCMRIIFIFCCLGLISFFTRSF